MQNSVIDKQAIFERIQTMIMSSTKKPKFMSLSTVRVASVLNVEPSVIEDCLNEFVKEGRLVRTQSSESDGKIIYRLP